MFEYRYSVTTDAGKTLHFTSPRPNQQWALVQTDADECSWGVLEHSQSRATMVKRLVSLEEQNADIHPDLRYKWELHKVEYHPRGDVQFFCPPEDVVNAQALLVGEFSYQWLKGSSECYVVTDTSQWSFAMWERVKRSDESWFWGFETLRHFIAGDHHFSEGSTACITCGLKPSQLPSTIKSTKED